MDIFLVHTFCRPSYKPALFPSCARTRFKCYGESHLSRVRLVGCIHKLCQARAFPAKRFRFAQQAVVATPSHMFSVVGFKFAAGLAMVWVAYQSGLFPL